MSANADPDTAQDAVDTWIVSRLNDPWKLLFVDIDIGMLAGMVMLVAFLAKQYLLGLVLGGGLGYLLHNHRRGKPTGYLRHLCYWHLPAVTSRLKRTPPSHLTETLG